MTAVSLTFPAQTENAALARQVAAAMAARAGLTIDQVEDVRLAVDEAVAELIVGARSVTCEFTVHGGDLTCRAWSDAIDRAFDTDSFAWTVMRALVDDVVGDVVGGRPTLTLRIGRAEAVRA